MTRTLSKSRRRKRVRICVTHDWQEMGLKQALRRKGMDGYRMLRRCPRCGRKGYGPWKPVIWPVRITKEDLSMKMLSIGRDYVLELFSKTIFATCLWWMRPALMAMDDDG